MSMSTSCRQLPDALPKKLSPPHLLENAAEVSNKKTKLNSAGPIAGPDDKSRLAPVADIDTYSSPEVRRAHPFQPCHLSMLRSLYADKPIQIQHVHPSQNSAHATTLNNIWERIDQFLRQRKTIEKVRHEANILRGVHEEAGNFTCIRGGVLSRSEDTTGDEKGRQISEKTQLTPVKSAHKRQLVFTPQKISSMPIPEGSAQLYRHPNRQHPKDEDTIDSWSFITKLLGGKTSSAVQESERSTKPFLELMDTVESILQTLVRKRQSLMEKRRREKKERIRKIHSSQEEDCVGGEMGVFDYGMGVVPKEDDFKVRGEGEEDFVAQVLNKIDLWKLLAYTLKRTLMN